MCACVCCYFSPLITCVWLPCRRCTVVQKLQAKWVTWQNSEYKSHRPSRGWNRDIDCWEFLKSLFMVSVTCTCICIFAAVVDNDGTGSTNRRGTKVLDKLQEIYICFYVYAVVAWVHGCLGKVLEWNVHYIHVYLFNSVVNWSFDRFYSMISEGEMCSVPIFIFKFLLQTNE